MKGVLFSNGRYTKGVSYLAKMVHKRARGQTLEPLHFKFCSVPTWTGIVGGSGGGVRTICHVQQISIV